VAVTLWRYARRNPNLMFGFVLLLILLVLTAIQLRWLRSRVEY